MDGKPEMLPGARSTAVRVMALPPTFPGHKVSLGSGDYTFCLDIAPAPGLNWQEMVGVKVSRLVDSSGRSGSGGVEKPAPTGVDNSHGGMVVFARPGVVMRFDPNGNPIMPDTIPNPRIVPVPLKVATPTARSLKRLEGVVYGEMNLLNQHLVTIADPAKNTGRAIEGPDDLKVKVLEVREALRGGQGLVRVQFEYPSPWVMMARKRRFNFAMGWPEPPQPQSMSRSLQAFDALGKPFPVTTSGHTDFSDDGQINIQTMQFTFRGESGLPAKLVVVGPRTVFVEVPFAAGERAAAVRGWEGWPRGYSARRLSFRLTGVGGWTAPVGLSAVKSCRYSVISSACTFSWPVLARSADARQGPASDERVASPPHPPRVPVGQSVRGR